MAERKGTEDASCPFCGEHGFDLAGLKTHIAAGWCDAFNDMEDHRDEPALRGPEQQGGGSV